MKDIEKKLDKAYRQIVQKWMEDYDKAANDATLEPKGFYVDKHQLTDVAFGICRSGVDSEVVYRAHEVVLKKIKEEFANSMCWDLEVVKRKVVGLEAPIVEYYLHRRYERLEVVPSGDSYELVPIYDLI